MKVTHPEVIGHQILVLGSEDSTRHPLVPSAQTAWKNPGGASRKTKSKTSERPTLTLRVQRILGRSEMVPKVFKVRLPGQAAPDGGGVVQPRGRRV